MRSKNKKLSKAKADKYFSLYIRERDKNKPCITCGAMATKDCGHFLSRRFENTRYDEQNAHGQCQKCNRFEYGNQYEHGVAVDKLYGEGASEKLRVKSRMSSSPRNQYDYEQIAELFKNKYNELCKKN